MHVAMHLQREPRIGTALVFEQQVDVSLRPQRALPTGDDWEPARVHG